MNNDDIKSAYREMITKSYKDNFQRDISEEEIEELVSFLVPRMEDELKNIKGYSDAEFRRYMDSKRNELLFSPRNVIGEVVRAFNEAGEDVVLKSGKYKRLREIEIAARVCLANRKLRDEMLMILPQDSPDIVLALMGSDSELVPTSRLEVMAIPEIVKGEFSDDLPQAIVDFVKQKKFLKDYGGECSLVVGLDFTQMALDFDKITEALQSAEKNPYSGIWLTFASSEDGKTMGVIQVFPKFFRVDYNLEAELGLLY